VCERIGFAGGFNGWEL